MNAFILVDIQNDFLPGGALAVPHGDEIIPLVNRLQPHFKLVVATQDWHPANHGSFAANHPGHGPGDVVTLDGLPQILWPVHCVQQTAGAELAPALHKESIARVFPKGTDPAVDSYSGFFDNGHRRATGLGEYLQSRDVTDVYIAGLATDYCVKATALDAVQLGLKTHVIADACRGVNVHPGDVDRAIDEMGRAGVAVVQSADVSRFPKVRRVEFYRTSDAYGEFSNFARFPIEIDGTTWPTTEHCFQAKKSLDSQRSEEIRRASSPKMAARMGRDREYPLRSDWEQVKEDVMQEALLAKFTQHPDLCNQLLATGDALIVEHSAKDAYWGNGGDGRGRNRLGQLLMAVRDQLRSGD